jgi:hypothetical protein
MKKALAFGLVIGMALVASACSQKTPAEAAISAAQTALDAVKGDAKVYVPDQLKAVEDAFAAVKASFDGGDYTKALADATALLDKVTALKDASEAKRKELSASWSQLSKSMPPVVASIQARVTDLSTMRRLPRGLSKENFEAAKAGLDEITQAWSAATGAMEGGDLVGALAKAAPVKAKALEVFNLLGMPVPDGLK